MLFQVINVALLQRALCFHIVVWSAMEGGGGGGGRRRREEEEGGGA